MKRLLLISASLMFTSLAFAQSGSNNALFNFDNAGTPKEVRKLGTAPEFPFLRNMASAHQVYMAIKRHASDNTPGMDQLNDLLMQIGYTNGAQDLKASDVTEAHLQPGMEGNMGSRGYTYNYYRLAGNPSEFKAWRIKANDGDNSGRGALYLFAKCGNAFFPKNNATACVTVPVNLTTDQSQITIGDNSGMVAQQQVYVYYAHKRHHRHEMANAIAGISDRYPSKPILVSDMQDMTMTPQTYNVSLSTPETNVSVCPDNTLNLTANINVEKVSAYTGNYPDANPTVYKKVSKHHYKMIARRMRRIHRKEDKVARRTHTSVDISTDAKA